MARPVPTVPIPTLPARPPRSLFDLRLQVVTPMFGGGTVAREVDMARPVTAKAVRGHLRFWWRACRAHGFTSAKDLFEAEAKVWGAPSSDEEGASSHSPVNIVVGDFQGDRKELRPKKGYSRTGKERYDWSPINGVELPKYVLFPFENDDSVGLRDLSFQLIISHSRREPDQDAQEKLKNELEAALWAWITFGGVGSRTRRGLGSLRCSDPRFAPASADPASVVDWIRTSAKKYRINDPPVDGHQSLLTPKLHGASLLYAPSTAKRANPILRVWAEAAGQMRAFRQDEGPDRRFARIPGGKVPGPSRWPEAATLRAWLAARPPYSARSPTLDYFPRADIGLPIGYQRLEAKQIDLVPLEGGRQRMASPVILKAVATGSNSGVPIALVLNAPHPWDTGAPVIGLTHRGHAEAIDDTRMVDPAGSAAVGPMLGKLTAREAFVEYLTTIAQPGWSEGSLT